MVKQRSIIISCHCTFIKSLILLSAVVGFSSLAQEGDPFGGGGLVGGDVFQILLATELKLLEV